MMTTKNQNNDFFYTEKVIPKKFAQFILNWNNLQNHAINMADLISTCVNNEISVLKKHQKYLIK